MTLERFTRENTPVWQALEQFAAVSENMDFISIVRLRNLYRLTAGHLSYARDHFPDAPLTSHLNTLVTRAHHRLHIRRQSGWRAVGRSLAAGLPRMVRRERAFVLAAMGLFLMFTLYGYLFTLFSPDSAGAFLPEEFLNASGEGGGDWDGVLMSSMIMVNNIQVSVLAFGLGLTLGLGTLYVFASNGMMLGALAAVFTANRQDVLFWSLILPHGVWELFAICLAGAAGLRVGFALLRPGLYTRRDALVAAGRQSVSMMGLVCVLLVLAAVVEGFFTPADIPPGFKLLFSGVALALLVLYLFFGGKGKGDNSEFGIRNSEL